MRGGLPHTLNLNAALVASAAGLKHPVQIYAADGSGTFEKFHSRLTH